ncbi:MAG: LysR family transcriptional regulator [Bdellovibrionales bacterium]
MSLNSFGLDAFYMCAQEKNFTRAAQKLNITQSAFSQRIKNLEDEISTTLFIRERKGIRLTEAGEKLLRYCQTRLQLEQELLGTVIHKSQEVSGVLRVAGYSTVVRSVLLPTMQALQQITQKIQFQLISKETFDLLNELQSSKVDFVLIDKKIEKEGLESLLLGHESYVRIRKSGSEFSGYFLDHDEQDETTIKYLKVKSGSKIKRHYFDDIYGILDGVKLGLGDAIVPLHLIKNLKGLEVVKDSREFKIPVYLNFYQQPVQTQLAKVFIEKIKIVAGEILGG